MKTVILFPKNHLLGKAVTTVGSAEDLFGALVADNQFTLVMPNTERMLTVCASYLPEFPDVTVYAAPPALAPKPDVDFSIVTNILVPMPNSMLDAIEDAVAFARHKRDAAGMYETDSPSESAEVVSSSTIGEISEDEDNVDD